MGEAMVSAKVTAGIKYCGGCNPRFERGAFAARLKEEFAGRIRFEDVQPERFYDILLVISGCTSNCADFSNLKYKKGLIFVTGENSFEQTTEKLRGYLEK